MRIYTHTLDFLSKRLYFGIWINTIMKLKFLDNQCLSSYFKCLRTILINFYISAIKFYSLKLLVNCRFQLCKSCVVGKSMSALKFFFSEILEHGCILTVSWKGKCALKKKSISLAEFQNGLRACFELKKFCSSIDTTLECPLYTFLRHFLIGPLITCLAKLRKMCFISQSFAMWLDKGMIILRLFTWFQDISCIIWKKTNTLDYRKKILHSFMD